MKKALITGITGQDGAYLAELLLSKGYEVHGIKRRSSSFNTSRIDHLIDTADEESSLPFHLHFGDVTDATNIIRIMQEVQPDEVYNLAAQSHVAVSFETPEYTAQTAALGTLRILEALHILGMHEHVHFYQASTSELFGNGIHMPYNEQTPFRPCSPYAAAKLYAYWITVNYREAYGMFAANGILFNHESPLRGETFVTRKITRAVAAMYYGSTQPLKLGNLDAKRDWGYAKDYVHAMWLMMNIEQPHDLVIATGESHSVREFVETAFAHIGITIVWRGKNESEQGIDDATGNILVSIDPRYYRPTDVQWLLGDASKARELLGWQPTMHFHELVKLMVEKDCELIKGEKQTETKAHTIHTLCMRCEQQKTL